MAQLSPISGAGSASDADVTPKPQTTSVKNTENGLLVAKWSAFWAHRHPRGVLICLRTRYCEY